MRPECRNQQLSTPTSKDRIMDIGITKKDREKIADGLSHLLADSFTLYLKTHNFRWL